MLHEELQNLAEVFATHRRGVWLEAKDIESVIVCLNGLLAEAWHLERQLVPNSAALGNGPLPPNVVRLFAADGGAR